MSNSAIMHYTFILKNDKTKNYRLISQLLIFFNLLGFIFLLINSEERILKNLLLLFSILITGAYTFFSVLEWFSKKTIPDSWHRIIFGLCAISWFLKGYWWLSILLVVFVLIDILAHRKLIVTISEKIIRLPSIFKKDVEWNELNNLILKDELLTIDFKNNKLFQHIITNSEDDVDEKEFNDFCKSRLSI